MKRSLEMAVDALLAAWIAVAVAQHLATVVAVLPGWSGLVERPDLRAGYILLGLLLAVRGGGPAPIGGAGSRWRRCKARPASACGRCAVIGKLIDARYELLSACRRHLLHRL